MKKATSLLLALVMVCSLFSVIPVKADAYAGGYSYVITQPTCTQPGEEYYISYDGTAGTRPISPLGHNWGAWTVIKEATCTEGGEEVHTCKRCGAQETVTSDPLGHEFGEWYLVQPSKYNSPAIMRRDCVRADIYEEKTIEPSLLIEVVDRSVSGEMEVGSAVYARYRVTNTSEVAINVSGYSTDNADHKYMSGDELYQGWPDEFLCLGPGESADFQLKHTVTPYDINYGEVLRQVGVSGSPFISDGKYSTSGYVYSNTVEMAAEFSKGDESHSVHIELAGYSAPENIKAGDTIVANYIVTNTSNEVDVSVTSYGDDNASGGFAYGDSCPVWPDVLFYLEPGESATFQLNHVVSKTEIEAGLFVRTVWVGYSPFLLNEKGQWCTVGQFWSNETGFSIDLGDPTEVPETDAEIYLLKALQSAVPERGFFVPDDTVAYSVLVFNNAEETVENVELSDRLSDGTVVSLPSVTVAPKSFVPVYFTVTLTGSQCAKGNLDDYVTAKAGGLEFTSNIVTIPVGYAEQTLSLTKTETSTPTNGSYYTPGETIRYEITVTNTGEETYTKGTIEDLLVEGGDQTIKVVGTLKPNESETAVFEYTVKESDSGSVVNVACFSCEDKDGKLCEAWASCESPVAPYVPKVQITKTVTSAPENGLYYIEGEQVFYELSVANADPNVILEDVELYDAHYTDSYLAGAAGLSPFDVISSDFAYTVTAEDAKLGFVNNNAYATFSLNGIGYIAYGDVVTVKAGIPDRGLTITKAIMSAPKNGSYYTPGETVVFRLTVYNNSMYDADNVTVLDPLYGLPSIPPIGTLKAGDSTYIEVSCDLSKLPVNCSFSNSAELTYTSGGYPGYALSNTVVFEYREAKTELSIVKKETSDPKNGWYYVDHEPVTYTVTVTNTGDTTFKGGDIIDILASGDGIIGSFGELKPGESYTATMTYTGGDSGMGFVHNQAAVIAETSGGGSYFKVSNVVVTNYGEIKDIDDVIVGVPGDCCKRSLIAYSDGGLGYSVLNCKEHTGIDTGIREAVAAAGDAAGVQAAYEKGIELWANAIDALYEEMLAVTFGPESRTALMSDRMLFRAEASEKLQLLKVQYPDAPEVVAELVCAFYREKCADLCWLYHSEAGEICDSSSADPAPVAGADCRMELIEEDNGYLLYCLKFCSEHLDYAFNVNSTIVQTLMNNSDVTAESWSRLRGMWTTLLDAATAKKYDTADGPTRTILMADRRTFDYYIGNYEQMLLRFCPDQGYADEAVTRELMLRTLQLCGSTEEHVYVSKANAKITLPDGTVSTGENAQLNSLFGASALIEISRKSGNGGLIAGVCAAVVVAGGAGAFLYAKGRKKKSEGEKKDAEKPEE